MTDGINTSGAKDTTTTGGLSRRALLRNAAFTGMSVAPVASLLAACEGSRSDPAGESEQDVKTLLLDHHGGRVQSPDLWNPLVSGFTNNAGFHQALAEPLFILNYESGEIEPWLGESFTSNDTLDVWTLTIKDGITWSDGEAYDADDIVFTIEVLLKNAELNNAAPMQEWVDKVRKVDKTTVEFTLKKPNPRFQLDYFSVKIHSSLVVVPEHIWRGKDPLTFKNYDKKQNWPVFTGPYQLSSASPTRFVYTRRGDWWGAKADFKPLPQPERLEWIVNETEDIRVARATDHQLHSVADLTAGAFESLKARNKDVISWLPEKPYAWSDPCTRLLSLNNAIAPWNDREMRWALNYAIDREEIVRIAYEGTTTPARFFYPNYPAVQEYVNLLESEGLFEEYPILTHDPDKAKQIFESKGYTRTGDGFYRKGGKELRLQIDAPTDFIEIWRYAEVIGEQLQRAGINATVRKLAIATWGDNLGNGRFDAVTDWSACGSVTEPWLSMNLFHARFVVPMGKPSESNAVRWKNAEYSKHVDALANLPLGDKRIEGPFVAAARIWLRELPFLPIAHARKLYAFDTRSWTGWATSENNYLQPTLDWANAHKIIHSLRPAR
ncbi:ABC transporter substrate-binding protein [Actinopolymorpha alba]|uniref:ABC transporter substrate-binding protein n=1 Tax=Actinopolymorpha alba TaxID=533267 RepID=UPI00037E03EE|nr:ABC transporter substrate-binding protein [Actinopolymorpha alba]